MKKTAFIISLIASSFLGTGCMSFKVGSPETRSAEYKAETVFQKTESHGATNVAPVVVQEGDALSIGLKGEIETKDRMADIYRKVVVKRQNRMSFGLFPGFAERGVREGGLQPMIGFHTTKERNIYTTWPGEYWQGPLFGLLYTPWALVVTPFAGSWDCHTHHWKGNIEGLDLVSEDDRMRLGVNTCSTDRAGDTGAAAHYAWLGFHRFLNISIDGPLFSRNEPWTKTTTTPIPAVAGPYEIEVEIPAIGYKRRQGVLEKQTKEIFFLPAAERAMTADATIRFFPSSDKPVADNDQRAILEAARSHDFSAVVRLKAKE